MLAHVLPVTTVVPALALTDLVASSSNGFRLSQHVVRSELYRMVPALLAGSALGAWLLFTLPLGLMMPLLGVFVVLYALNGLRPKDRYALWRPLSQKWAWWYGGLGGVLSALFGAGGWVYAMYLVRRFDNPEQIRATQTVVLMFSSVVRVALFLIAGRLLDPALLWLVLYLLPAVALGLFIGHHVSLRMDRWRFMQMLYGVLLLTGGSLVVRSLL